jgi:hypothetical protein
MVTKTDLILLLTDMQSEEINVDSYLRSAMMSQGINLDVLKFINDNRQLDVAKFYELIRKNYNLKKSSLYKNIVKEEVRNPDDVLTTLAALNLQILLFAKNLKNNEMFLKHSRAEEITRALNNYYKTYDLIPCFKLLKLIKADLKAFESIR